MFAILHALGMFVADLFKSRSRLEAENLLLRHQLASSCGEGGGLVSTHAAVIAALLYPVYDGFVGPESSIFLRGAGGSQPGTVLRWHRVGFNLSGAGSREGRAAEDQSWPRAI